MRRWMLVAIPTAAALVLAAYWAGRATVAPAVSPHPQAAHDRPAPRTVGGAPAEDMDLAGLRRLLTAEAERWEALEARVANLEESLALSEQLDSDLLADKDEERRADGRSGDDALPVGAFDFERLLEAGWDAFQSEDLRARWERYMMAKLDLNDRARREGWFLRPRYREELQALDARFRREVGDAGVDASLYATGRPNRVAVTHVIRGSSADQGGVEPGDVILSYAGRSVFSQRDLKDRTARGRPGQSVELRVLRDGSERRLFVDRGPLGALLRSLRAPPES